MITAVRCERKKRPSATSYTHGYQTPPPPPSDQSWQESEHEPSRKKRPFLYPALLTVLPIIEFGGGRGGMEEAQKMWGELLSLAPDMHVCTIPLEQALATIEFVLGWQLTVSTLKLGVQGGN